MFDQYIKQSLAERQKANLFRRRVKTASQAGQRIVIDNKQYINFASNDYLGLAANSAQDNSNIADLEISEQTETSGATSSPLVTGYQEIHLQLESMLLEFVNAPRNFSCLLFNSGFAANQAVIHSLFNQKCDSAFLFQDKLNHASLLQAGVQAQAMKHNRLMRFRHNDLADLTNKLHRHVTPDSRQLIVTEGVFSMDGDTSPIKELQNVSASNNAMLMLDDAHGFGILGEDGKGAFANAKASLSQSDILVVTFGKALGAQGAAVIAAKEVIEYLENFAKEYIYSTHVSPLQAQAVMTNLSVMTKQPWRREKLYENIDYFHRCMEQHGLPSCPSTSPIQPYIVGSEAQTINLAQSLKAKGLWLTAIRPPTVPSGTSRLRITITAEHQQTDIDYLVRSIAECH